jgi:hypothetical protein
MDRATGDQKSRRARELKARGVTAEGTRTLRVTPPRFQPYVDLIALERIQAAQ